MRWPPRQSGGSLLRRRLRLAGRELGRPLERILRHLFRQKLPDHFEFRFLFFYEIDPTAFSTAAGAALATAQNWLKVKTGWSWL